MIVKLKPVDVHVDVLSRNLVEVQNSHDGKRIVQKVNFRNHTFACATTAAKICPDVVRCSSASARCNPERFHGSNRNVVDELQSDARGSKPGDPTGGNSGFDLNKENVVLVVDEAIDVTRAVVDVV
jgi:hypothetical protein